ncbi:MAG: efflux RND transporter periplasmic adaptor subunit, partial [Bacteroidales bacterium]|nr:efflux RND transporter periplasmic adaptor subunit [Bacteroidales bacterium]
IAIRPKITAFIEQQHINEGDFVKEGQLLFTLEDVQIKAAMNVAEANIQVAAAQLETSQLTLNTKEELHKRNIISDYDLQLARNDVKVKESQLAQAQAQLANAEQEFAYTRVTSPADGIVGVISMSPGNLIGPNSEKPLTQVTQISIMRIYFSMSERQALALSRQYGSLHNMVAQMPPLRLKLSDGSLYPHEGQLITISGSVDVNTGALRARANFPNPEYSLRSGYTGTILIPYTVDSVFVIPQSATFEIQNRRFVYVVDTATGRVKSRAVEVHPLNDGLNFVVLDGLVSGEQIVTEGAAFLKEDQLIEPISDTLTR